ncbi:MAG: CPBP family glutamic-type intramembrane protease, partial [Verrucomicrobiota bacterium]
MQASYRPSLLSESVSRDSRLSLRLGLLIPALVLPTIAALLSNVVFPGTKLGNASYLAIKVFLLLWPVAVVGFILKEKWRRPFQDPKPGKSVCISTLVGLSLLAALVIGVKTAPVAMLLMEQSAAIAMGIMDKGVAMHYLAFALTISVVHAGLEEFFWRWFVFGQLRQMVSRGWAHGIAAMAFAAHHFVILGGLFPVIPT